MIYLSLTLSFLVLFSENFKEAREVVEMTKVIYETSYEDDKQHILAMMSTCTISVWRFTQKSSLFIVLT